MSIKDVVSLRNELNARISRINQDPDSVESRELLKSVELLSHQLLHGGLMISDHLTGQKFCVLGRDEKLLGGGPGTSRAIEVPGFSIANMCGARKVVEEELNKFENNRRVIRHTRILINNSSSYPLVYLGCGDCDGYFFSDAQWAFQQAHGNLTNTLNPGNSGGIFHTQSAGQDLFGSSGYVSFMVPVQGRNYVVIFAFYNTSTCATGAGIVIKGEDGAQDQSGNIIGHGVTPTPTVPKSEIEKIGYKKAHSSKNNKYDTTVEKTSFFKVTCKFTNNYQSEYILDVENC